MNTEVSTTAYPVHMPPPHTATHLDDGLLAALHFLVQMVKLGLAGLQTLLQPGGLALVLLGLALGPAQLRLELGTGLFQRRALVGRRLPLSLERPQLLGAGGQSVVELLDG